MKELPRIYVDSNCFITLAEIKAGERKILQGKSQAELQEIYNREENDSWHLRQAMRASRDQQMLLYTSFLTIAEATTIAGHKRDVPSETKIFLEQVISSGRSGVRLSSLTRSIAERARDLRWVNSINLKGPDAIHVATAMQMRVTELWTGERKNGAALSGEENRKILLETFNLRICAPSESKEIPQAYLQEEMNLPESSA